MYFELVMSYYLFMTNSNICPHCGRDIYTNKDGIVMDHPRPSDEDRKNYSYNCKTSPYFKNPEAWLKEGQKVRAKFRIYDLPGDHETRGGPGGCWSWVSAEKGDIGTVVDDMNGWPVVRFERTGCATNVTDFEVEPV